MNFTVYDICVICAVIILLYGMYEIFNKVIFPWIVDKKTVDVEINPKWIMNELQNKYYGFHDIDIVIVNCPLGMLPRFRMSKIYKDRIQLLIPEDTSTRDIDRIAQMALAGKIKIKYGLWFPNKPTHWLAILNYMLDGGDIKIEATKWEEKDKKSIDLLH